MKRLFLSLGFTFIILFCFSQTRISMDDVSKHVGDSVSVCGKMEGGRYLENGPTLLNLDGDFPKQKLTLVIWKDLRSQYETAPEEFYKGKALCVSGKITVYRERPQIVIYRKEQITTAATNEPAAK